MTRLVLPLALAAAMTGVARADDAPTDGGAKPDAAPPVAQPEAAPKAKFKNAPPHMFMNAKISGEDPHLPDAVKVRYAKAGEATGTYKICVDVDGDVVSVEPIQSIADGDATVISTLRSWKFKPLPIGLCSISRFVFTIGAGPPKEPLPPNAQPSASTNVVKLSGEPPHLPDALKIKLKGTGRVTGVYQICVGRDGHVESVTPKLSITGGDEAIMTTLRTWTFQPPQKWKTVCSPGVFTFDLR